MCQGFVSYYVEHKDFLSSIITKTLKLGVDTKLCNTVYGSDFIYLHEVMQGSSREVEIKEWRNILLNTEIKWC